MIEFFRDDDRGFVLYGLLSTSQFIAILTILGSAAVYYFLIRRPGEVSAKLSDRTESWIVAPDAERIRLDQFLVGQIPGESRSQIQNWIRKGISAGKRRSR